MGDESACRRFNGGWAWRWDGTADQRRMRKKSDALDDSPAGQHADNCAPVGRPGGVLLTARPRCLDAAPAQPWRPCRSPQAAPCSGAITDDDWHRGPRWVPRSLASRSAGRACRRTRAKQTLLLTVVLSMAASLTTAAASLMPVGFISNASFAFANPSSTVQWSSAPFRIPNFLVVDGLDDGIEYSISNLAGPLEAFSHVPQLGPDYSLLLNFANDRLGGQFTFNITLSYVRALLPAVNDSAKTPLNETVIVANRACQITVWSTFVRFSLDLVCPSSCDSDTLLSLTREETAQLLGVESSTVEVTLDPDSRRRRLLAASTSVSVNVTVGSTNASSALAWESVISSSPPQVTGATATLVSSGVFFFDAAAAAGGSYLQLAQDTWVIQSCATCGGDYNLPIFLRQITASNLAVGPDGLPLYTLQVDYRRHRTSSPEGYGPWRADGNWLSEQGSAQSVSTQLQGNVLSFSVQNATIGEVEYSVRIMQPSVEAIFRINVAPTNSPPSFTLILPASTVEDDDNSASDSTDASAGVNETNATEASTATPTPAPSGGQSGSPPPPPPPPPSVRRLLSQDSTLSLALYENSAPFVINITNISTGGWAGATNLSYSFSFSQEPLSLVSDIFFDDACSKSATCAARVSLHPNRHGSSTLTVTVTNSGGAFTPLGNASFSVNWALTVANINEQPSFVKSTSALNVDEDSSCVLPPITGLNPLLARRTCVQGSPLLHEYPNFFTSITAGLFEDTSVTGCPPESGFSSLSGACLNQNVTFTLTYAAGQLTSVLSLFAEAPTISPDGTLRFRLAADQVGTVSINATIRDDGSPPLAFSQLFSIFVLSVNDAPSYDLVPEVEVLEGSGAWSGIVVSNITAGCPNCTDENDNYCASDVVGSGSSTCQTVGIEAHYIVPYPNLFTEAGQPRLERISIGQARLTFTIAPDQFGEAYIDIVLYDTGGRMRGGQDSSPMKRLTIRSLPINDPPTFELTRSFVTVEENSGDSSIQIATDITAGKSNEDCTAATLWCEAQRVTFIIEYIEGAQIFSRLPAIDASGMLTLRVFPGATGVARVYTRLEDDTLISQGSAGNVSDATGNVSATKSFAIVVEPVEYQANFTLERNVACLRLENFVGGQCTCPSPTKNQKSVDVCAGETAPGDTSRITIIEDSGPITIEAFATGITNAAGYLPASLSVLTRNETTGLLEFQEQRADAVAGEYGMEYATDFTVSSDGRHLYAVEAETDSVSVFDLTQGTDKMTRVFRITDGQRRFLFRGFNSSNFYDRSPLSVETQGLSSLSTFLQDGKFFALAAQGGDAPRNDVRRRKRTSQAAMTDHERLREPADLWSATTACWVFDVRSMFSTPDIPEDDVQARFNVNPSDFTVGSSAFPEIDANLMHRMTGPAPLAFHERSSDVRCGTNGCSYARNISKLDHDWCPQAKGGSCACSESHPTLVEVASVHDLTGRTGPLFLTGPQCKSMPNCTQTAAGNEQCRTRGVVPWNETANDWDTAHQQIDLRTFLMANGQVQAMQFDDHLNSGLFLTFDMRKVVHAMPRQHMSVEIWFTIDVPLDVDSEKEDCSMSVTPSAECFPVRRALVGVEGYIDVDDPDDFFCSQGWSLSYTQQVSTTTLRFHIGLEGSDKADKPMQVEVAPRIPDGVWQHVVATYDGERFIRIYHNGVLLGRKTACRDPPCGAILYPGIEARYRVTPNGKLVCPMRPYNFSIGAWKNGEDELKNMADFKYPNTNSDYLSMGKHKGAMHMVRIYEVMLTDDQVLSQYGQRKDVLLNNSLTKPVRAWAVMEEKGKNSPSVDFAHSAAPTRVVVHGFFDVFSQHRCEWHAEPPRAGEEVEIAYSPANTTDSVKEGYLGQTLTCFSAMWKFGPRLTRFYISYLKEDGEWQRMWMKVCLEAECGFLPGPQGREQMYFAKSEMAAGGMTRYTLRNNVNTVPKDFRFVQSSAVHRVDMNAPHKLGKVSSVELSGAWSNLIAGTVRILDPVAGTAGRFFKASFVPKTNGTSGVISILEHGHGYPQEGGQATLCHVDSFDPMVESVTGGSIESAGSAYVSGTWEVLSGEYLVNASINGTWTYGIQQVNCSFSPKGSFRASAMFVDDTEQVQGGNIEDFEVHFHGSGCSTELFEESVALCYPGTRKKQENSITQVVGLSELFRGALTVAGSAVPMPFGFVPEDTPYIDAVPVCVRNCTGRVDCCVHRDFVGRCDLLWEFGTPAVVGITILNHGTGFDPEYPTDLRCAYAGSEFDIFGAPYFIMIPTRARLRLRVARGGVMRFETEGRGVATVSEPGLAGGEWSGIWGNRTGESVRPLWSAAAAFTPVSLEVRVLENVTTTEIRNGSRGEGINASVVANETLVGNATGNVSSPNNQTYTVDVTTLTEAMKVRTFVLVSTMWDGISGNRVVLTGQGFKLADHEISYLLLWDSDAERLNCVQAINTSGTVAFHHFKLLDIDYLVAVNYREVFADGETSTVARSAIYRMSAGNPAGDAPSAPGLGGLAAPEKCSADSPLGRAPIWTLNATRFRTAGAVSVDTFVMNHSTKFGQIMYLVVANYYDSDADLSTGISKLYMVGRAQNSMQSRFGVNESHIWNRCSDSQEVCTRDSDCEVHQCDQGCVVTQRPGQAPSIQCTCNNRPYQTCSTDMECNSGITCTPQRMPVPLEDHASCVQNAMVEFDGNRADDRLVLCETQTFDVEAALSVVHWQSAEVHVIVFGSDTAASKVFISRDGAEPFVEIQALPTSRAAQLQYMNPKVVDRPYLLLAQGAQSILYQWNGTWLVQIQSVEETMRGRIVAANYIEGHGFMYAIFGGGNERFHNSISLLQGVGKILPSLDAPGAVDSSPDGRHVYVVSQRARTISQYLRDSSSGELEFVDDISYPYSDGLTGVPRPSTPWGSDTPTTSTAGSPSPPANQDVPLRHGPEPGAYGYPVRSLVSLLMVQDGTHLYAASFYDSAVHVWARNATTGQISWQSAFSDAIGDVDLRRGRAGLGPSGYFMRGPRAMTLFSGNSMMMVACSTSRSAVLLRRNDETGELAFVDAVRDGERDITSFIASAPADSPRAHPFPTRLGGSRGAGSLSARTREEQERQWARTAQVVRPFFLRGRQMLAVAASDDRWDAGGAAIILEWRPQSGGQGDGMGKFEEVQLLEDEATAVDIAFFEIDTAGSKVNEYLAVANAYGRTSVYLWEENGFVLHHLLPMARLAYDNDGCSCLCKTPEELAIPAANRSDFLCGACFSDAVVRQSTDSCTPRPAGARDCNAKTLQLFPRAIRHFFVAESREHFLAVAYWSADNADVLETRNAAPVPGEVGCKHVYSHVYRWNEDTPRLLNSGRVVWGNGFEAFFPVATSGAIGVEHVTLSHDTYGTIDIVGFVEFVGAKNGEDSSSVRLFRYVRYAYNPFLKTLAGTFEQFQVLPVAAPFHLHAFAIGGEGNFLAVSVRQNASAPAWVWRYGASGRADFLSVYDTVSVVLKWNGTSYLVYQKLGRDWVDTAGSSSVSGGGGNASNASNASVANVSSLGGGLSDAGGRGSDDRIFWSRAAVREAFDENDIFNATNCTATPSAQRCQSVGADEGWEMASGLRGVTSMYAFEDVDGEFYLAVAQSVCDPGVSNVHCNHTAQPMSAVLQWDRVHKRFTEALAFTDESHGRRFGGAPVRNEDILVHQTSLRIPMGRARHWTSIVVGGGESGMLWPGVVKGGRVGGRMTLLIGVSLDEGALVYEFRFKEVVGLAGASAVAVSPAGDFVYVASEDDKAIAVFALGQRYDVMSRNTTMFHQIQVLSEDPLEGGDLIRRPVSHGLRGIRELTHSLETDCAGYKIGDLSGGIPFTFQPGDACSTILVRGGIPRTQLPCGEAPPVQECSPHTPHLCTPSVDPLEPPAQCREVSFQIEALNDTALALFTEDGAPRLMETGPLKGALSFTPRSGVTGEARFRVAMDKADMGVSESASGSRRLLVASSQPVVREFVISVLPVNDPPVIRSTYNVSVVSGSRVNFTKIFASHISAEGAGFDNFTWQWSLENITFPPLVFACRQPTAVRAQAALDQGVSECVNATHYRLPPSGFFLEGQVLPFPPPPPNKTVAMLRLFRTSPSFTFRETDDGVLQGLVSFEPLPATTGQARFYMRMHDGTAIDPLTGSSPISAEFSFIITVLPGNYAPSFTPFPASLQLVEGQQTVVKTEFVRNLTTGLLAAEAQQKVSFSVSHLEALEVFGWDISNPNNVVREFSITNGTLRLRMVPDFAGDVRMFIKIEDDAVNTDSGPASSNVALDIFVAAVNDPPSIQGNGKELYVCRWTNVTYTITLNQSEYLTPLYQEAYDCDFKDGTFCGYMNASRVNDVGSTVPWVLANQRIEPVVQVRNTGADRAAVPFKYLGSGPEYGHGATPPVALEDCADAGCRQKCREWPPKPFELAENEVFCVPEYYAAANAYGAGFDPGSYGIIQSKPLRGVADGIVFEEFPGGTLTTLRVDTASEVFFSFFYHMWDGDPSFQKEKAYHGSMGSLALQARPGAGANWTTVWENDGATTNYHEWVYANVTFNSDFLQGTGLELRFWAERATSYNEYSIIAIDTLKANATVFRDDRMLRCTMEVAVTGVFFDQVRVIERVLPVEQPPDELATQEHRIVLTILSGNELFFDLPTARPDGSLVLPLARAGRGTALMRAVIEDDGPSGDDDVAESAPFFFEVVVDGFEELPPFTLTDSLSVLDGAGLENFPKFAEVATLANMPDASQNFVRFVVKCTSTAPGMWEQYPAIDPVGTLTLAVTAGFSGQGYCAVQLGGADLSVSDTLSAAQYFFVKVWPRPELLSVSPAVADPFTLTSVTIRGRHFGSLVSRGYSAPSYGNISVYVTTPYTYAVRGIKHNSVRWEPCVGGTKYVGDEELRCILSPGAGMRDLKVEVIEDGMNRTGTLLQALVGAELWLGGTAEDPHCQAFGAPWPHRQEAITHCGQRGFLGSGPGPMHLPPTVDMARLNISSSIRALVVSKGRIFLGGSFAQVNSTRVNGIVAYDRQMVRGLSLGLDGSVSCMSVVNRERSLIVIGGSFTKVHRPSGSVVTGGIAIWDETSGQWGALGGVPLHGLALALLVKDGNVFVGGRFTGAGSVKAASVAVFKPMSGVSAHGIVLDPSGAVQREGIAGMEGGKWSPLGEGVKGNIYALAAGENADVYAGGRFHLAGGVRVQNVARWENVEGIPGGGYWTGLVDSDCLRLSSGVCGVDGDVWALAYVGEYLYVGGQFSAAGGKPARNIARFFSGVWEGLGHGVDGAVHVLTAIRIHDTLAGSCVYVAGDFKTVEDKRGAMDALGLARWCVGDPGTVLKVDDSKDLGGGVTEYWEKVALPEGVTSVRALSPHH